MKIPFNKPYLSGKEKKYIRKVIDSRYLTGNGVYSKKCQHFFEKKYGIKKALLTTSCTSALEMAALLCQIKPGDEVIMPSYTYVSTANAFALRGAKIVFCDSRSDHPGMDESLIEGLITERTKVIVPVHYAGSACNMDVIMKLANQYNLLVAEDAAQAINSYYTFPDGTKKALGSIGHFGAFSFHETKNITCGEGGLLAINDEGFSEKANVIYAMGTNKMSFLRGKTDKYEWVDIGSSFIVSELNAAFLWAQLEQLDKIQNKRLSIWSRYNENIKTREGLFRKIEEPSYSNHNGHLFCLVLSDKEKRQKLIKYLNDKGINAIFHYVALHSSQYYSNEFIIPNLPLCNTYSNQLLRLPLFYDLKPTEQSYIIAQINKFEAS